MQNITGDQKKLKSQELRKVKIQHNISSQNNWKNTAKVK